MVSIGIRGRAQTRVRVRVELRHEFRSTTELILGSELDEAPCIFCTFVLSYRPEDSVRVSIRHNQNPSYLATALKIRSG